METPNDARNLQEDILNLGSKNGNLTVKDMESLVLRHGLGQYNMCHLLCSKKQPNAAFCLSGEEQNIVESHGQKNQYPQDFDAELAEDCLRQRKPPQGNLNVLGDNKASDIFLNDVSMQLRIIADVYKHCASVDAVIWPEVNDLVRSVSNLGSMIFIYGDPDNPQIKIFTQEDRPFIYIENELIVKAILEPVLAGTAKTWTRIRVCEECGRSFFYKLERAKFCSTACRIKAGNKKRRNI